MDAAKLNVTIQLDGEDVQAGVLFPHVRRGVETATFVYDDAYLTQPGAFALSPDLPLVAGAIHSNGKPMFDAFEDCMPDRWGRNLMLRGERNLAREEGRAARTLFERDYLAGVGDETRQGALRFWSDGRAMTPSVSGVPREVSIPDLLSSADRAARDMDADVRDLLAAGSSLGGARPKASVIDEHGVLNIAKFPKADESLLDDTCAWEAVTLELAGRCGIRVPNTRLVRVAGRAVLLLERFDRCGDRRVPYLSAMTAVQGHDGESYSYLEIVDFLEREGAKPEADIRELWLRVLFSCAVGNTDDHLRNHGFVRQCSGWRLSPAFDVNPTRGDNLKFLSTAIDFDEREASPDVAIACCEYYRVELDEARRWAGRMAKTLRSWRKVAVGLGVSAASIEAMASCFEAGIDRLERAARGV